MNHELCYMIRASALYGDVMFCSVSVIVTNNALQIVSEKVYRWKYAYGHMYDIMYIRVI